MDNSARPQYQTVEVNQPAQNFISNISSEPVVTVSKKKNNIIYFEFVLLLIFLILVVVASILGANYYINKNKPVPTPTPIATLIPATPVPTSIPVEKNKTYQSYNSGIKFEYLQSYLLTECSSDFLKIFITNLDEDIIDPCLQADGNIEITKSQNEFVLDENYSEVTDLSINNFSFKKYKYETYYVLYSDLESKIFDNFYKILIRDEDSNLAFEKIKQTIKFLNDNPTENWISYKNVVNNFGFLYPPSFNLNDTNENEINLTNNELNLVIKFENNLENAQLTATEIANSIKNLSGWKNIPQIDLRTINDATAQLIQGEKDNKWKIYVVIWHKNNIIQMAWEDGLNKANQEDFDLLFSTLGFE